jgi:signal transduction histidine kinase
MPLNRLPFLMQLIELSTSTVSYGERLDNFVHLVARNLKFDLVLFFVLDKTKEDLYLNASSQGPVTQFTRIEFPLGLGAVGKVAQTRQHQIFYRQDSDAEESDRPLEELHLTYQMLAGFPVADDNFLYGVLLLVDKTPRILDASDLEAIQTACRMLAGTIRQALLHDEAKKRIAELSMLFDVGKALSSTMELEALLDSIVSIIAKVINARGASLKIVDEETGQTKVVSEYGKIPFACLPQEATTVPTGAICGELSCSVVHEPDHKKDTHSYLGVPLSFKGSFRGMLCVYDKVSAENESQSFDAENQQLLLTLAGLITSGIENALAFQQIEELAAKNARMVRVLTVLQDITWALMTTIRQESILDVMVNGLTLKNALGYDRAKVLLVEEDQQILTEVKGTLTHAVPETLSLREILLSLIDNSVTTDTAGQLPPIVVPLRKNHSVLSRTVSLKKPFHIIDAEHDPRVNQELRAQYNYHEFLTVPMVVKDSANGVIIIDNYLSRRPIQEEDINFLTMFANQAALAIENSRLYATIETNNRELTLIRERMLESDRLAALSSLAEGMAHEIRNPLVSIGGFARRISKQVEKSSPLRQYVDVIVDEVGRLEKLLHEVLDYTGDNLGYFGEYDLNRLVEDALTLIKRDIMAHSIELVKDFVELPTVHCDDRQIKQVFYNLFQNARQVMEDGGVLTIRTYPVEKADGLYAAVAVSDTGGGIPLELLHNIFNPFFTTKEHGTGLGLAIAQRIISRHYGEIEINNDLGKGVTFIVTLPIAKYCLIKPSSNRASMG